MRFNSPVAAIRFVDQMRSRAQAQSEATVGRLVARARIRQPEVGFKPFSALLGALQIKPVVEVELSVPVAGDEDSAPADGTLMSARRVDPRGAR